MMGRTPETITALKSLLTTRVPGLVQLRVFSDVPKDHVVRLRVWDGSMRRQGLRAAVPCAGLLRGGEEACEQRHEAAGGARGAGHGQGGSGGSGGALAVRDEGGGAVGNVVR